MIFSKFFKPTWQHKDSNIRISAVNNELSGDDPEQRSILLQLLADDKSELVRRAVLLKLNDFNTWWQAYLDNSNKNIRLYAEQQIEAMLANNHSINLSNQQKEHLLDALKNNVLLENWLKVEADPQFILGIYQKLAKPQLLSSVFTLRQQSEVQLALVALVDDKTQLEKLVKKTTLDDVQSALKTKIAMLIEQAEKPEKIVKQTQLILAKLLALKDVSDYQEVIDKKQTIEQQWQEINKEFNYLSEEQQTAFFDKFQEITLQLEKIFAHKAEAFEQQKIAQQLAQQRREETDVIEQAILANEQQLGNAIFEHNTVDEQSFLAQLTRASNLVNQSVLTDNDKQTYLDKISTIKSRLSKLPDIAESVTNATHLISRISQLALPETITQLNEKEASYLAWLSEWQAVSKAADGALPASIVKAHDEIVSTWQHALKPLRNEQQQQFNKAQRKLADVKRLINTGKYNAAFGVFKNADKLYQSLNDKQQARLARDYQFAQEKINELSDWEHYIATPRKQELLVQINALVEQPLDNPVEQSEKVKQYRTQWNLLGHADDELDEELNLEFNQACEQAFAPCRLYFAEQEKLREQHLATRQTLLAQVKEFADQVAQASIDWQQVDANLNRFKQKWRDAGEVEHAKYKQLNNTFTRLLKPVKSTLYQFHQENIAKKQEIINQANAALAMEDINAAVNETKRLQRAWRDIGYCGPKDENALWHSFRKINDQVFARRAELQAQQKQQSEQLVAQYKDELQQIIDFVDKDESLATIKQALDKLTELKRQMKGNEAADQLLQSIAQHAKRLSQAKAKAIEKQQAQMWQMIITALNDLANGRELSVDVENLPAFWQKQIVGLANEAEADIALRHEKTIIMEILSGSASPEQDKNKRLALQVELMQEQLSLGQALSVEQTFSDWLKIGRLSKQDLPLLQRVKEILLPTN